MKFFHGPYSVTREISNGASYFLSYLPPTKNRPPVLTLTVPVPVEQGDFAITEETGFDRFAKNMGIALEIPTHDPAFDDRFFVSTDSPELIREMLGSELARRAVESVFNDGFMKLFWASGTLTAELRGFREDPREIGDKFDTTGENLVQISKSIPTRPLLAQQQTKGKERRNIGIAATVALVVCAVLGAVVAGSYYPLDGGKMFGASLRYSVPIFLLVGWLAVLYLRGRSSSHRELVVELPVAAVAIALLTFAAFEYRNGHQDTSPPVAHRALVKEKYRTSKKHGYSYHVKVASWRGDGATERFEVPFSTYNRLEEDRSYAVITTKAGRLNYEWVVAKEF